MSGSRRGVCRQYRRSGDGGKAGGEAALPVRAGTDDSGGRSWHPDQRAPSRGSRDAGTTAMDTALRAPQVMALAKSETLQLSLFDTQEMVEFKDAQYPGERLIACRNPLLAEERSRKRSELLQAAEAGLKQIVTRTRREKRPLRGKDKIALAV